MRAVEVPDELAEAFERCRSEAAAAFGNGSLFVERLISRPRHIEVQILADGDGNVVHLFDRDCSVQLRHQKVVEIAPAPGLDPAVRERMFASAIALATSSGYTNAGTVEFIVDDSANFYFLEVNKRIQVEHPITEEVTGIDLVKQQIMIAMGEPLRISDKDLVMRGHAIECRINAEDPFDDFRPCPGRIEMYYSPGGRGVRVDSHAYAGYTIPSHYDSMIGKLIVHAPTRAEAIAKMRGALDEFRIGPIRTTIPFQRRVMDSKPFVDAAAEGGFDIHYIERMLKEPGGA